ncbi:MAG: UvrD-helicase domain-containing protein [Bacteroidota bacterium]|nr:UvrD-helicase domain-containing protein [Bacteroidota bacterium]
MDYLETLNPSQRAAVQQIDGPVMIIAGAGSGKTRVLTYRIVHMLHHKVDPFQILSLTFTNKAAKEMRHRVEAAVGMEARNIWMGTFHSIFSRILRKESDKIGYPRNFTIYDSDDSKSLIRTLLGEMQLDEKLYKPSNMLGRISAAKNVLISAEEYLGNAEHNENDSSSGRPKFGMLYKAYQDRCFRAGAMDFDDLLVNTHKLFKNHTDVLHKYQHQFKYIMVDEFQDTNHAQYMIIKKLCAVHENIAVVGDDAQSIYAFRGANIKNILGFQRDFPDVKTFKLEQNYRSTQTIVNAASSIIEKNKDQLKKNIWTDNEQGERIRVFKALTDNEEGRMVASAIFQEKMNGQQMNRDFAILYRTNAQSRSMEEALRKLNIPYKIYGGLSFYQRKEVKDLLAYYRVVLNPQDEEALKRIVNYPARGIGKTSLDKLALIANQHNITLWQVMEQANQIGLKNMKHVEDFVNMIKAFQLMLEQNAYEVAMHIAKTCGVLKSLYEDKTVEGIARYENTEALLNGIKEFSITEEIDDEGVLRPKILEEFMSDVALMTNDDKDNDPNRDHVSLMTIHSAKGLEYKFVHVVGLEENLFPSQMALNSRQELEEERRLFYVALTRAMKKLTLSFASSRFKFGNIVNSEPSRFLQELNPQYLNFENMHTAKNQFSDSGNSYGKGTGTLSGLSKKTLSFNKAQPNSVQQQAAQAVDPNFIPDDTSDLQVGMQVNHQRFGSGMVINMEGTNDNRKATVDFEGVGKKTLVLKFAKLKINNA